MRDAVLVIAMNALAVGLSFVIVAQDAPPSPADVGGNSAADSPADDGAQDEGGDDDDARPDPAATQGEDPASAADQASAEGSDVVTKGNKRELRGNGQVGLGIVAVGAVVATSTAAGATLIEAMSKNDSDPNAPPDNPELVQVGGFATLTLMSLSAGAILIGGALIVSDVLNPAPVDATAGAE